MPDYAVVLIAFFAAIAFVSAWISWHRPARR